MSEDAFPIGDFIQDFLDESSEHLQNIRRNLLALETGLNANTAEVLLERVNLINELFRSFHTLKGLCGMVGLPGGEALSHRMESVLRAIQRAEIEASQTAIDHLLEGTRLLEAEIETLRTPGSPSPERESAMEALADLLPSAPPAVPPAVPPAPSPTEPEAAPLPTAPSDPLSKLLDPLPGLVQALSPAQHSLLAAALQSGQRLHLAVFSPSPDKATQGFNVNLARQQLSQAGQLLASVPLVGPQGIRFAFLLSAPQSLQAESFLPLELLVSTPAPTRSAHARGTPSGLDAPNQPLPTSPTLRVDLARMEELMRLVSDLVVTRSRLMEILPRLRGAPNAAISDLETALSKMERSLRDLRQTVVQARMVPMSEIFSLMPLAVRDLARASSKEVRLTLEGEQHEIDKLLVERLLDPMLHLVRNAIAHGIEPPSERLAAHKPRQGQLTLSARPEGDQIVIEVRDDGRGLNFRRIAEQAAAAGLIDSPTQTLTEAQALELICTPGFSTRSEADLASGRGVGLDVVHKAVTDLSGSLSLTTSPGQGSTFRLRLPLTLSIVDALLVRAGPDRFAIPQNAVEAVIELDPAQISHLEGLQLYPHQGSSLTLLSLTDLFRRPSSHRGLRYALISVEGDRRTALVVDGLIGMREVVVRPVKDPLVARPGIAGATELGDGSVILILDLPSLFQSARHQPSSPAERSEAHA